MQRRLAFLVRGVDGGGVAPDSGLDGLDALARLLREEKVLAPRDGQDAQGDDGGRRAQPLPQEPTTPGIVARDTQSR